MSASSRPCAAKLSAAFSQNLVRQLDSLKHDVVEFHRKQLCTILNANALDSLSDDAFLGLEAKETAKMPNLFASPPKIELMDEGGRWELPSSDYDPATRRMCCDSRLAGGHDSHDISNFAPDLKSNDSHDTRISGYTAFEEPIKAAAAVDASLDVKVNGASSSKNSSLRGSAGSVNVQDVSEVLSNIGAVRNHSLGRILGSLNEKSGLVYKFIYSPRFVVFINTIIFVNAIIIGVQVEWNAQHIGETEPGIFEIMNQICNVIFICELACRIFAERIVFFTGIDQYWNAFDSIVVLLAIMDLISAVFQHGIEGGSVLRSVRMWRILRTLRALRTVLVFRELRLVVQGIGASLVTLMWLMVLLFFMMFILGTFVTSSVAQRKAEDLRTGKKTAKVYDECFSSLLLTLFSLFQAISTGVNWRDFAIPLYDVSPVVGTLFVFYVAFVLFAVLNVVTGIFVDNAQKAADADVDFVVLDQASKQKSHIENVYKVFRDADLNDDGALTLDEFSYHVRNPIVQAYFKYIHLDFEAFGTERLFSLLDFDGGGRIEVSEFVAGCSKFRGKARSLDLAALHHDVRRLDHKFERLLTNLAANVKRAEQIMRSSVRSSGHSTKKVSPALT